MHRSRTRTISILSLCALSLIGTPLPSAQAAAFSDVKAESQFSTAITSLQEKNIVEGYADGSFKPGAPINRAEFLKIVLESRNGEVATGKDCFPDVRNEWFARFVCAAKQEGIIAGYPDGTFKPERSINFVEAAKILAAAFQQDLQASGGEWYEPYAQALEEARAIPTTIARLDIDVTRGEMAEMLWRLTEGKTDQPAKGVFNITHPQISVNTASDEPQRAGSCADLSAVLQSRAQSMGMAMPTTARMATDDGMVMEEAAMAPTANKAADYSETNVQVAGVDEADIVKTDGTNVYLVRGNSIRIVRAVPADTMQEIATITVEDDNFTPQELYVADGKLIVIGSTWSNSPQPRPMPFMTYTMEKRMIMPPYYQQSSRVSVHIYDISDAAHPTQVRALKFDGTSSFTRRIDDRLFLVIRQDIPWYVYAADTVSTVEHPVPLMTDSADGGAEVNAVPCANISILPRTEQSSYIVVASVPVSGRGDVKRNAILGSAENIYASLNNIYVTQTQWQRNWNVKREVDASEQTRIFRFALSQNGDVSFQSDGVVPGHALNQFSMDEHNNRFRIATEISGWTEDNPSSTNVFVLNEDLQTIGTLRGIAPGEHMYAARFMGNRAYLVTFKTVDPLFVIDLTDSTNPTILGKLKIPGYSNYLHPYDETHLIGFGKEVDESIGKENVHSSNAVYYTAVLGVKIAMFDVSDVEHPRELFKEVIGGRGSDSPVLTNHKALLFDKERGFFALPVSVTSMTDAQRRSGEQGPVTFQGAYVYDVSLANGFALRGSISHYTKDAYLKAGDYWYNQGKDIERILRLGTSLVTVSASAVQSHDLETVDYQGGTTLSPAPGWEPGQYWEE